MTPEERAKDLIREMGYHTITGGKADDELCPGCVEAARKSIQAAIDAALSEKGEG